MNDKYHSGNKASVGINPLVTVIVPIYNGEKYIEQTVLSVMNQDYINIELICIIDGTKDSSAEILQPYENSGKLTLLEQANIGASLTRNKGMKLAKGDYVLLLDQDDVIEPSFLSKAVSAAVQTKSAGVVVNGRLIDSSGNTIRRMYRFNKPTLLLRDLLRKNQIYTSSQVLFNRQKVLLLGGFDAKNAGIADDWDLMLRILISGGKLTFIDELLMSYRLHDSNSSRNLDKMLMSELNVLEQKSGNLSLRLMQSLKSYRYLYHAYRFATADSDLVTSRKSISKALGLNAGLLLNPRFYCYLAYIWYKSLARATKT
jgi:glycosyltransferase involved in cell wall biosynthesis